MSISPVIQIRARIPEWSFHERLRKVRRDEAKLTQAEFAKLLGVKESRYSAWEAGRNKPDILALSEKLEEVTGISKYWFRGDLENEFSGGPGGGASGPDSDNLRFDNLRNVTQLFGSVQRAA